MSEESKTMEQLQAELEQSRSEVARLKSMVKKSQSSALNERQSARAERARLMGIADASSSGVGQALADAEEDRAQLRGEVSQFKDEVMEHLQQMTQQRLRSDSFVQTAPVGIAYLDKTLFYRWANPTFTTLMNRPLDKVVNHPLLEVFPQAKEHLFAILNEVIKTGKADPAAKPVMIPFTPGFDEGGKATNWDLLVLPVVGDKDQIEGVLVAIEVTERVIKERQQKEQIETLIQAKRKKSESTEDASRKMRSPLASISGGARALEASLVGGMSEEQRQYIAKIQGAEGELTRIVDDVLELARIEAGSYELHYEEADVSALVRDNIGRLAQEAENLNVHPVVKLSDEPLIVKADRRRLDQVLQTLLGNAIHSTKPGGHVAVTVIAGEHEASVEIVDGGTGISAQELGQLFDQFSQLNLSKPDEFARAGKGLAISKTLIELHGGTIWATSEVGKGSTFWFKLPLARQEVTSESSMGLKVSMLDSPVAKKPSKGRRHPKNDPVKIDDERESDDQ